jgi:mannan endo-1,4-beta-mannosidase
MNLRKTTYYLVFFLASFFPFSLFSASDDIIKPVDPRASSEAKALLKLFYNISGKYTLTGQHNYPNTKSRNSQFAAKYLGKTPVIFSTDLGFAKDSDKDSYLARPDIVEEIKRQHQLGSIIALCWHAVPPTADEPVTFRPPEGASSDSLMSVQGQLLDRQFKDVLTHGTKLYKHWCAQVDVIALYLKKLQEAHIPVLWRPYHEMNGDWFWWGGRRGDNGTIALYRQLFDRLVHYHKLNNLIWVWSVDRPAKPEMQFADYYPGDKFLDILALDVYGRDFKQSYYDSLVVLSKGKPIVFGEVGNPPSPEVLKNQPKWSSYVIWSGMVRNTLKKQHRELIGDARILGMEDTAFQEVIAPYRISCGLLPIATQALKFDSTRINFSGDWLLNEESSVLDNYGVGFLPSKLKISQSEKELIVQRTFILEYADDRITADTLFLDGRESKSEMWNSPRNMQTKCSARGDTLIIDSKVAFKRGGQTVEMSVNEFWTTENEGTVLSIKQYSNSPRGERKITMVFNKK